MALVLVGMFMLVVALLDYYLFLKKLSHATGQKFRISLAPIVAAILFIIGILVLIKPDVQYRADLKL